MHSTTRKRRVQAASFMLSAFALSGIAFLKPATLKASADMSFQQNGVNYYMDDEKKTITAISLVNESATSVVFEARSTFSPDNYTFVIGDSMLKGNTTVTSIKIKSGFKRIEKDAFSGATKLKTVDLSVATDLQTIGNTAFQNCDALTTITGGANCPLKYINYCAFYGCDALTEVDLSQFPNLYSLGNGSFYYCKNLKTVTVPKSLTSIGTQAFQRCEKLTAVEPFTFNGSLSTYALKTIGDNAFQGSGLTEFEVPNLCTTIGAKAFADCQNLATFSFYNTAVIEHLPESMCENDTKLKRVDLPWSLKTIGPNCFKNCTYNGTALSYVGEGKTGIAFFFTDTTLAMNLSTYKVDDYVKVVDANGAEAAWGTAFQGVNAHFKVYPNNKLHVTRTNTPKSMLATYNTNNTNGKYEFVYTTGNDGNGSLSAGPQNLQAPIVGNAYKGDSTFKLTTAQDEKYDLKAVRLYDSTGHRMTTGEKFKAGLGYYYEYEIYASENNPVDLVYWGRVNHYTCSGATAQSLANTTTRSIYTGLKSISQSNAKSGQTFTCYAVVHPKFYKDSEGNYVYPNSETSNNVKTLIRRYSLSLSPSGGEASASSYVVYSLPVPAPKYGQDYIDFEGYVMDTSPYFNLTDGSIYYGTRKTGTTGDIKWWSYKATDLLPETEYDMFVGVHYSATDTYYEIGKFGTHKTPALMLVKSASATLEGMIGLNFKMNLTPSLTQKNGSNNPYFYLVMSDQVSGSTLRTSYPYVTDCFYQSQSGNYGDQYNVTFPVAPIRMNDPVTIKNLYGSKAGNNWGLAVSKASNLKDPRQFSYTVMKYLNSIINNSSSYDAETVNLMKATKAYGIYAQQLFNHNYSQVTSADRSFASSYVQNVTLDDVKPYKATITKNTNRPEGVMGASIIAVCDSTTALRIKFFFDDDVDLNRFTYWIDNKEAELEYDSANDYYYLEISGIAPTQLEVAHSFKINEEFDDGTNAYYKVSASVLSYCYSSINNTNASTANKQLSKALYLYNKAADAYQAKYGTAS